MFDFSWEGGGTFPKIVINLPWTFKKLYCKREPYLSSSVRDLSMHIHTHIDRQTHRHPVTFIQLIPATLSKYFVKRVDSVKKVCVNETWSTLHAKSHNFSTSFAFKDQG